MLTTSGKAETDAQEFLEASRVFLQDDFLPKLVHCLDEMPEGPFGGGPTSNRIAPAI